MEAVFDYSQKVADVYKSVKAVLKPFTQASNTSYIEVGIKSLCKSGADAVCNETGFVLSDAGIAGISIAVVFTIAVGITCACVKDRKRCAFLTLCAIPRAVVFIIGALTQLVRICANCRKSTKSYGDNCEEPTSVSNPGCSYVTKNESVTKNEEKKSIFKGSKIPVKLPKSSKSGKNLVKTEETPTDKGPAPAPLNNWGTMGKSGKPITLKKASA